MISRHAVLGDGWGALEDNFVPAMVVYVDKTIPTPPQLPDQVDNVPVRIIMPDPLIAY